MQAAISVRSLFWIIFFVTMPGHALHQPGNLTPQEQHSNEILSDTADSDAANQQITPAIIRQLQTFLYRFVDAGKTPEQQVALFTDHVEYYNHGTVGKAAILRDVERFVRYWPHRKYRVTDIHYISRDPGSDKIFVSYTIDFEVANQSRAIAGRANYGALIHDLGGSPKVESIKERVLERKSGASARQ